MGVTGACAASCVPVRLQVRVVAISDLKIFCSISKDSSRRALSNSTCYAIIFGSKHELRLLTISPYEVKPHFISYAAICILCMYLKREQRYSWFCERAWRSVIPTCSHFFIIQCHVPSLAICQYVAPCLVVRSIGATAACAASCAFLPPDLPKTSFFPMSLREMV